MGPQNRDAGELPLCLSGERNLVLIGYRATGKTEVGALLAEKLGRPLANPELIGKTGSHGCIRLANWDALRLARMVHVGTPVRFTAR